MNHARKGRGEPIKKKEEVHENIAALRISATEHERAKKELRRYLDNLEPVVKERASALAGANSERRGEIAERKWVEEELGKSDGKFRAIFDNTSDGIFLLDLRARKFFMCNATCAAMLGYTQQEFSNLDIADIHPGDDLPFIYEQIGKFSRGQEGIRSDIRFKRKDGSIFVADLSPALLTIAEKEYLVVSFKDITERKHAEEALRASEQRFRALVEATSDFVWEVDQKGFYTYASPKVKDLLGYEPEGVIGKTPFDLMPPDEAERVAKVFGDIAKSRKPFANLENTNLHKDGQRVVLETSGVPIFDARGDFAGYRGIDRDITERKQAEEKYRIIFDNAVVGIYQSTPQGQFLAVNPAFARIFGYESPRQIIEMGKGAAGQLYVRREQRRAFQQLMKRHGQVKGLRSEAYRRDGRKIWMSENARVVLDSTGRIAYYEGFVRDITTEIAAEEALKQAAQRIIEAQEAERKRVARGLHDGVGQLLSSVRFRLASVGKKISDQTHKSYPELDDSLGLIEKAVQEIRTIIHNLRPVVLDDLGLLPAVRALCEEFRERTNVKLKFRSTLGSSTRLAPEVELALFRIVQEALHNIEKHSRATRVSLTLLQKSAKFQIKVKDNGIGFDHLAASKKRDTFSGYGLPIILERAASIGGNAEILTAVNKGTEVIVRVPLNGPERCD